MGSLRYTLNRCNQVSDALGRSSMSVLITVQVYMLEGCVKVYYHARNGTSFRNEGVQLAVKVKLGRKRHTVLNRFIGSGLTACS